MKYLPIALLTLVFLSTPIFGQDTYVYVSPLLFSSVFNGTATQLRIVNPSEQAIQLKYFLKDDQGQTILEVDIELSPWQALFLGRETPKADQEPLILSGTYVVISDVPVVASVILRRNGDIIAMAPVTAVSQPDSPCSCSRRVRRAASRL